MSYCYDMLNVGQKRLYDKWCGCFADMRNIGGLRMDEKDIFFLARNDHPEYFWVPIGFASEIVTGASMVKYSYSRQEARSLREKAEAAADRLIGENINEHQSDYDKVLFFHDYLAENVVYDNEGDGLLDIKPENHNIIGPLLRGRSVCEGFALAMKYLCDRVGVEALVVTGEADGASFADGGHAWNIIKVNGLWHHFDVTFDNCAGKGRGQCYCYFGLSDEQMEGNHTWDRSIYPPCESDHYSYYRMNSALIETKPQLIRYIAENMETHEPRILFRIKKGSVMEREIAQSLSECVEKAFGKLYARGEQMNCSMNVIPEQLVYDLSIEYF